MGTDIEQSPAPEPRPDWMHLAWTVLTSTQGLSGLALLLAMTLTSGMLIPQGASPEDLLRLYPYAVARAMQSLGLHDLWSSWFLWLLVLLGALIGLGVLVRSGELIEHLDSDGWDEQLEMEEAAGDHAARISRSLGNAKPRVRGTSLVWTTGLRREALGLVLAGLAVVVVASFVGRSLGLDARLSLQTGVEGEQAMVRSLRWHNGGWVEARSPLSLNCERADPQDNPRRRSCTVGGIAEPVSVRAGQTTPAGDLELTPLSERVISGGDEPQVLVRRGEERAKLLRARAGHAYVLEDGTRITAWSGPDGPIAVVRSGAGGPAQLHVPSGEIRPDGPIQLAGVPGVTLEVGVSHRPEQLLTLCGVLFLFVGFLLLGLVPELTVVMTPRQGAVFVSARSRNRSGLAARWATEFRATPEAEDPDEGGS